MRISDWSSDVCSSDLKASGVIGEAQAEPTFAKLTANAFDQEQMFRNDLTSAQIQVGAMEGRRDYAGDNVAGVERDNVATEQGWRTGSNQGQREAATMRSEERRVGKEGVSTGRSRWSTYHSKKKKELNTRRKDA